MALTKRLVKGSPLTAQEMDDNLDYLEGLVPVGSSSGTAGSAGTSGTDGTSGTSGVDGAAGVNGTNGTAGTTGTAGSSGTSGLDGTNYGSAGTSGIDGTAGTGGSSGTTGTGGTSGTSAAGGQVAVAKFNEAGTVGNASLILFDGTAVSVSTTGAAGTALITITGGTGGAGSITFESGSTVVSTTTTVTMDSTISLTDVGGGTVQLSVVGGGAIGSSGTNGTSGSGGTSGANGGDGTGGTSGSGGTSGTGGSDGTHGTSGDSGTNGSGGTNGTGGTSGSSGLSTTLSVFDSGITEVTDVRYIQFSNEFTVADLTNFTASVSMSVAGGGGSANWSSIVGIPTDLISSSVQVKDFLPENVPSGTLLNGYFWTGDDNGLFIARPTSSIGATGGSGAGFPYEGWADITGSLVVTSSLGLPAIMVTGSVDVQGSVSASALHVQSVGQPYLTSPSSINLQAESGSVNIVNSVLRLASYSDLETGSLIAQNGDMVYNTTSNKFFGYANGAWVALS